MNNFVYQWVLDEAKHLEAYCGTERIVHESNLAGNVQTLEEAFIGFESQLDSLFRFDSHLHIEATRDDCVEVLDNWYSGFQKYLEVASRAIASVEKEARDYSAHEYRGAVLTQGRIGRLKGRIKSALGSVDEWQKWKAPTHHPTIS